MSAGSSDGDPASATRTLPQADSPVGAGEDEPNAAHYPEEWRCLGSLVAREGTAAAVDFCRRTMPIYRHALLSRRRAGAHPSFATLAVYRPGFIRSYCEFKRFVRRHATN